MRALANIETRIIRPLLDAMDRYPWGWAYLGVALLMVAWLVLTTHFGTFTNGPFPE